MQKIYWWIQQINRIGGTEMVSIDLANALCDRYDITMLSTTEIIGDIPYKLDKRIKVDSLGLPSKVERVDYYSKEYLSHFRIISFLILMMQVAHYYVFHRHHYQKLVEAKLDENTTLICSSIDTYMLAPKKGRVFFHYHFDSESFFKRDYFAIKRARVPDKFIFLADSTRNEILTKRKDLKDKSVYIYNPIRFEPELDLTYHNNTIVFVGRYAEQKNPLLALAIAKSLKEKGFNFKLKMFGGGALDKEVREYQSNHHLEDVVEINGFSNDINHELLNADVLLVTSSYEGFGLAMSEANALSRPWVSTNWGSILNERLVENRNGIVIDSTNPEDFADALIKLLSNKETLKEMKQASYEESKKLSKDVIVPEWVKILG